MANSFLNELLQTLSERGRGLLGRSRDAPPAENLIALGEQLLSGRGEASGVALARLVLEGYADAEPKARLAFLTALGEKFGTDPAKVEAAIAGFQRSPSQAAMQALHLAAEPPRQELMRRLNLAPGGTAALVRIREELLGHIAAEPALQPVDEDFTHLFASWFNRGFLVLRPIDWTTPANILERIIRYEAVHRIGGWEDLRRRLEPSDRRCFAFFHPQLVDEPLIFVEVALTREIPDAIAPLLAAERAPIPAEETTTAVFYSISNTQRGLAGVSFGDFLIKQVVEDLQRSLPNLKTFVTLSPVPGFAAWLTLQRAGGSESEFLDEAAVAALAGLDDPAWPEDGARAEALRRPLLAAAAHYFLKAKLSSGLPADPVARFHLRNGARLERINFMADLSRRGLDQAHGLMTNYLYDLDQIEKNHEAFAAEGRFTAAPAVRKLLLTPAPARRRGAAT
jgi:malonyl-CoA decarboxylase